MKIPYIAPEATVITVVPVEKLALLDDHRDGGAVPANDLVDSSTQVDDFRPF
jgi:hypothetical protein